LLEIDPSGDLIRKLAKDRDKLVRDEIFNSAVHNKIAMSHLEDDKQKDLIEKLLKLTTSERTYDRQNVARREDLLEIDPSGDLIRILAKDEDVNVRQNIVYNYREDLLKIDPDGDLIKGLANDRDKWVRAEIARIEGLLSLTDGKDIIMMLANDSENVVRRQIANREDLLEVDPSGDLIRKLADDEDDWVKDLKNIYDNYLTTENKDSLEECLLRKKMSRFLF
jgi:HEAT repeat protein